MVDVTKYCKSSLAIYISTDFLKNCYYLQLLEWSFTISSILYQLEKFIASVVFPVGMTNNQNEN